MRSRRRPILAVSASIVVFVLWPATAGAAMSGSPLLGGPDAPTGPLLGLGAFAGGHTSSYLRVREGFDRGAYLYLEKDLGAPAIGEMQLQLGWRFDPDDALAGGFGYVFVGGGARLPTNAHFNGGTLQGGTRIGENPGSVRWFVFELQYERELVRFGEKDGGLLALDLGLRFDHLEWRFSQATLAPTTIGRETGEDFWKQSIPIPIVGLTARLALSEEWDAVASAKGFRLNHLSSGRSEGGIVYVSESVIDATLGLAWKASDSVQLAFGYRFLYVDVDEESREDGNLIGVFAHGAYFTIQVTF